MKFSILGAGTWGTTLGQVLTDNGHDVLLYDINKDFLAAIDNGYHPLLNYYDLPKMKTTDSLEKLLDFSDYLLIAIPTAYIRGALKDVNKLLKKPLNFVNVSKGIEPDSLKRVSEIVADEIDPKNLANFALLAGPSHAEELILRQLTLLTVASDNIKFAQKVQKIFNNDRYLRVYTTNDLIGAEVGGFAKNAIAVSSGILTGYGFKENARAALITRGIIEIIKVVEVMGGKAQTAFGLTGIGDLIVTASSEHSRNFKAGVKIGKGENANDVLIASNMVVEGIRSTIALNQVAQKYKIDLPIIQTTYLVITQQISLDEALMTILTRELKSEKM